MARITRVRQLAEEALDRFDAPGGSVAASVRRAARVASLRQDHANQLWLQLEMTDLRVGTGEIWKDPAVAPIKAQLDTLLGAEAGAAEATQAFIRYYRNRTRDADGTESVYAAPIGRIESSLAAALAANEKAAAPENLTPSDTYSALNDANAARTKLIPIIDSLQTIVERVRSDVYSFLVATERELELGQARAGVFARAQLYVNEALAQHAPKALEQLTAAQDRLESGSPEDLAHAATSCRRALKSLADALYPATGATVVGADGKERVMSDDAYRNRLLQYVSETLGKHGQAAVIQSTLDTLSPRLDALDRLDHKGVHADVSEAEADACVVWTYLLAADLLRLADGSSALLANQPDPPQARPTQPRQA